MAKRRLEGKIVVVTGAGRGIGRAVALGLAGEGADLALASRTRDEVEETARMAAITGHRALALRADVSCREDVEAMVAAALERYGRIDILVNNAGVQGPIGRLADNDIDRWIGTVQTNLVGTFLCCRAVLPSMLKRRQGKIINLSGGGAVSPRPFFSAYGASKAAVVRLTETLAEEVREANIQVNAVAPGAVNTGMLDEVLAAGATVDETTRMKCLLQKEEGGVPPEKVAELVIFLASDATDGMTGRLVSLSWDNWRDLPRFMTELMASDVYTVRRIIPKDRGFDW